MGGNEYEDDFENDSSSSKKTQPQPTPAVAPTAVPQPVYSVPSVPPQAPYKTIVPQPQVPSVPPQAPYKTIVPQPQHIPQPAAPQPQYAPQPAYAVPATAPPTTYPQPGTYTNSITPLGTAYGAAVPRPAGAPPAPTSAPLPQQPSGPLSAFTYSGATPAAPGPIVPLGTTYAQPSPSASLPVQQHPPAPAYQQVAPGYAPQVSASPTTAAPSSVAPLGYHPPQAAAPVQQVPVDGAPPVLPAPPAVSSPAQPVPVQYTYPPQAYDAAGNPIAYDAAAAAYYASLQQQYLVVSAPPVPPAAEATVVAPPAETLKTYTVTDPKTGDLTYWFAGVQMVRKAVNARATTSSAPPQASKHSDSKHHSSKRTFVSSELRVWQSFRDPQPSTIKATQHTSKHPHAVALVPVPLEVMVSQYDESHGGTASSFTGHDLCTLAFSGTPEDIVKALEEVKHNAGKHTTTDDQLSLVYDHVNQAGHVSYRRRLLGVKKVKEQFVLGFGGAATPMEFATLAGRADNVVVLAKYGACKDSIAKSIEIAAGNQFSAVSTLLHSFVKVKKGTKNATPPKATKAADP